MSLESKFYNCLTTGLPFYLDGGKTLARVAKDLVEIASADIKYLSRDEVEHIIGSINTNEEKVQAICKLAIPDIKQKRKKMIKILHEFVKYQIEADNLINNEAVEYVADEIIKAIGGEEW